MTKVRIRKVRPSTRWQLVTFCGKNKGEARGVVDLLAIRKDHGKAMAGMKAGDDFQIILIQVKGGNAPMPTTEDGKRLMAVAKRLNARHILLAAWKKGAQAHFFTYEPLATAKKLEWVELPDLDVVFR